MPRTEPFRNRVRPHRLVWGLIVGALVIRGAVLIGLHSQLVDDPDAYRAVAVRLATTGVFGMEDGPTAWRPPLYPLLLDGCQRIDPAVVGSVGVLHLVLGVATVWLTWRLGSLWGLSDRAAALAALLVAIDPILLNQSTRVMTETLATFLAALALLALSTAARRPSTAHIAMAGIAVGAACLCRPTFLVWAAFCGVAWMCRDVAWSDRLRALAVFAMAGFTTLAPWIARNQQVFGRPIVATTHGGFTLWLANNDAFYDHVLAGPWRSPWDADDFYTAWDSVRPNGPEEELRADRACRARAIETIRRRPGAFTASCFARAGMLWQALPYCVVENESPRRWLARRLIALWYAGITLAALCGACAILGRWRIDGLDGWGWGLLLIVSFTAMHAVYWSNMRMRAPLTPVVSLLAAHAIARLVMQHFSARRDSVAAN